MKKCVLLLVLAFLAIGAVSADEINLGDFPVGQWLDPNYDAVWDFSTGNIRILDLKGNVIWNFVSKGIENFTVSASTDGPVLKFKCEAAGKKYTITKPLTDMDLILEIDRPGRNTYKVRMKKQ